MIKLKIFNPVTIQITRFNLTKCTMRQIFGYLNIKVSGIDYES